MITLASCVITEGISVFAVLHISFSNLVHAGMVFGNITIQLGAVACIAAAYSLHENGGTPGTLLYVLASRCTESTWDVGDLQVSIIACHLRFDAFLSASEIRFFLEQLVTNALLDYLLEEGVSGCPWHRYCIADRSEDVLRILGCQ